MRTLIIVIISLAIVANWERITSIGLISDAVTSITTMTSMTSEQDGGSTRIDMSNEEPSSFTNNWLAGRSNNLLFSTHYADYKLYQEKEGTDTNYKTILGTIQERSPLNDAFFSKNNMNHVKKLLAEQVYKQSGYSISAHSQSDNELLIIMRAIFLQYARNLPEDVRGQIAELNLKLLTEIVPKVVSKVKMELTYQRDHGSQPLPNLHPVNVSNAGTKTNRGYDSFIV
jgi:hypothetical protein